MSEEPYNRHLFFLPEPSKDEDEELEYFDCEAELSPYSQWRFTLKPNTYYRDSYWFSPFGAFRRFNSALCPFVNLFFSYDTLVNPADVDAAVNTMAVINALLLTVPWTIMGSLSVDNWQRISDIVYKCSSVDKYTHAKLKNSNESLSLWVLSQVYITIIALLMVLLYYLCRPRNADDKDKELGEKLQISDGPFTEAEIRKGANDPTVFSSCLSLFQGKSAKVRSLWMRDKWKFPMEVSVADVQLFRFRTWFKRGKIAVLLLTLCTILVVALTWTSANLYYSIFMMMPDPDYCDVTYDRQQTFTTYYVIALSIVMGTFYIVL